jgi:hypothetical protein
MNVPFKEQVDKAVVLMRREMEADPGEVWPRVFGYSEGDKLTWMHIDPAMMASFRDKNKIAAMIVKHCFSAGAVCAVFLSDCFVASPAQGKTFDDYPRDFSKWPKDLTRESLLIVVNGRGIVGEGFEWNYTRKSGVRIFAPEMEKPGRAVRNRFAFDLRNTTAQAAIIEALLRGRNGSVEDVA